jgi:hypothetical protein
MTECPKPNVYPGVPFAVYREWDAINSSFLHTLAARSPFHAKHDRDNPREDTPALRMGRALHSFILEPATFDAVWSVCPACDKRTKEGKALYAAFLEAKGARDEIGEKDFEQIKAMAHEVRRQQCIELVCGGQAEVSIVWQDKETGLMCKRRLDYERTDGWNHFITDLKSSGDVKERSFSQDIASYGYAMAAAFSIDGWKALTGDDSIYNLLAIEKDYHVAKIWEPDEETIAAGRDDYRQALRLAAECMKTGRWEAYGPQPSLIRAPEWYLKLHGAGPFNMR